MNTANSLPMPFDLMLQKTLQCSRYAKRVLETDQPLQSWLQANYATPCTHEEMQGLLQQSMPSPQSSPASGRGGDGVASATLYFDDEADLTRAVRRLRKQAMVKLILRDLNGLANLDEVMQAMTALAEICVQQAQACLMSALRQQFGNPIGETSGAAQELLVIGMGKLGGGELNVSSDIDLIFVYPEDGETDGPRKLGNHEFFTRLGRRLINIINELTADGYVFRVDMRLRPYGDSGPLVMSFAALEEYLVSQGREWERYAWIKARVISPVADPIILSASPGETFRKTSSNPQIAALAELSFPFVFRKYLDFSAIDSMRKLHAQIRQEVQRRDRFNNIKLGPGGIREIEFTAQVFQLIRGGRNAGLRIRPTQRVLQALVANEQLSADVVAGLDAAYIFLRNLEHRLQYLDDQQTQELPEKPEDQQVIAQAMGYDDFAALMAELDRHRALVTRQFEQIFGAQQEEQGDAQLWRDDIGEAELHGHLVRLGYRAASDSAQRLLQLRDGNRYRQLPDASRQRLDKLIPQFIALSAQQRNPDATLFRLLGLLEAISRRAVYLAFLAEYPQALQRLTRLIAASSWAGDYLTQHPALLDELLDAREIYQPPEWQKIELDLQTRLADCADDFECEMDVLRHVQQEQIFYLLAMDLQGLLPLEILSDHLSALADLILNHTLALCWATARKKHRDDAKFAIIAYGKLGGKELGYASDLDLIFLYDDDHPDAQEVYARLGQRINAMLGSYTSAGRLYETDLRLRPNGESGLLVSSINAFADYQESQAWVWEHQALTRARFSAGDAQVGAAFENIRRQVLGQPRDLATLRTEILAMRQKMHDGHPNNSELFDIKHDSGGMVDIEFMVQYLVLAYAHRHPQLTANVGNLALLKLAGELDLIPAELAEQVRTLYRTLRQTQHRMRLNNLSPCRVPHEEIDTQAGRQLWKLLFGGT
ncbi:MAG TPA: bifunctional [glutamate--ammonia ligase]-adenylyl-L-tyrosine phosphorylase/[glutamate--ammonia-ligase] adenylyltransferase [Gallionella sp.]|nr:bifunctional [glutamate--ammonia ligase]-adenylyl-L-tyrosine phosphorylase/[glutamate--ammonia-ligase] adenylyltransferase [Gallionella sp.]